MSFVVAAPEMMTSAAADLATIGSNVSAAHMVAAAPTVAVVPAAADEVSASIANLFSRHAVNYQAMAAQAAAFNDQFVQNVTAGAFSYGGIEGFIADYLQLFNYFEGQVVSGVVANPTSLLTPGPYEAALSAPFVSFLLVLLLPGFAEVYSAFPFG